MKKALCLILATVVLGALGLSAWGCMATAVADGAGSGYSAGQGAGISVLGVGKVTVTADTAILNLSVQSQASSAVAAQEKAAQAMTAVTAYLKNNGVSNKDITTTGYSIYPVYDYSNKDGVSAISGYTANNSITVKIRKIDNAGELIDGVVMAGGDDVRINNIYFTVDNPSKYDGEARELAMSDALARAQQLASLGGVRLGKPAYITESGGYSGYLPPMYYYEVMPRAADAMGVSTPISPDEIELTLSVQVTYNIQ